MAYFGYIPSLQRFLSQLPHSPRVLEVGTDRGVTLIPLVIAMASAHDSFLYMGVDIQIQESLALTVRNLGSSVTEHTFLMQENSLNFLPKLIDQGMQFDLVLLDGDHNYHTVSNEVKHLDKLVAPGGFAVIDDYDGKWSERDLWYAERPGYESNDKTTKPVQTEKQGVKPAVDEWLAAHPDWVKSKPIPEGEPVILIRGEHANR